MDEEVREEVRDVEESVGEAFVAAFKEKIQSVVAKGQALFLKLLLDEYPGDVPQLGPEQRDLVSAMKKATWRWAKSCFSRSIEDIERTKECSLLAEEYPESVQRAVGGEDLSWYWFFEMDYDDREAVAAWLGKVGHPLDYNLDATLEQIFRALVREVEQKKSRTERGS